MEISPPDWYKKPLVIPYKTLMGPGPSNAPPRVLHAMGQHVLGHMHPEVFKIMDEIKLGIQYIFQTKNALTLAISTSGHGGMEAIFSNLVEPGDKVLVAVNGIWGSRASGMVQRCGGIPIVLTAKLGDNFRLEEIEWKLKENCPKLMFVVQGESSTGIYQPLEGLGDICRKYNCLLAVDTVASLCTVPFKMDKWNIDVAYTGSQKALSAPPGITPISFSEKAQKVIFERKTSNFVYYWDMKVLGQQWNCFNNIRPYHHTVSANMLYGLREALAIVCEERLENIITRHQQCAQRLYAGIEKLGLKLLVTEPEKRLPSVTTVLIPSTINADKVLSFAMERYSLEISGGLGPTRGVVFRIGLMGYNATIDNVDFLLSVLGEALNYAKKSHL